jgi:carbonic anhydrase
LGDEVYPGENILDKNGNRVDHTRTLFVETNTGRRAALALESVAAMDYIFRVQTSKDARLSTGYGDVAIPS